jgi:hypothetical protein
MMRRLMMDNKHGLEMLLAHTLFVERDLWLGVLLGKNFLENEGADTNFIRAVAGSSYYPHDGSGRNLEVLNYLFSLWLSLWLQEGARDVNDEGV